MGRRIKKLTKIILKQLERAANSEETKAKRGEVEAKMKMIGEVLS